MYLTIIIHSVIHLASRLYISSFHSTMSRHTSFTFRVMKLRHADASPRDYPVVLGRIPKLEQNFV
jgi:hypothetical protein